MVYLNHFPKTPVGFKNTAKTRYLKETDAQRWIEGERHRYYKLALNNLDTLRKQPITRVKRRDALYLAGRTK